MKIIFGLGNPGKKYEETRHNVGFMVVDAIASRFGEKLKAGSFNAEACRIESNGETVHLIKPKTFMNQSGESVRKAMHFYKEKLSAEKDILIVLDDFALPIGKIRFRESGSAGGHQGLASILESMNTLAIPRLRMGIGSSGARDRDWVEFVLERFTPPELKQIKKIVQTASEACIHWVDFGTEAAMQKFNGTIEAEES